MCSFLFKLLKRSLLLPVFLGLQGCHLWQNTPTDAPTNENSTLVGHPEGENGSALSEEPARSVRAAPRRPVVVEEPVFEPLPLEEPMPSPVDFSESTVYVVHKGDTLTKIAHRFRVPVLQLMQENQLKNKNKLYVGQVLTIPRETSFEASSAESVEPYRVVKGDTLSKIAQRLHIPLTQLQQVNGLDRNAMLSVGQTILVPKNEINKEENGVYCVQKGDTLSKIAKRFGTSVAKLREQNHLKTDVIVIGQTLYLSGSAPVEKISNAPSKPDAAPIESETYTVKAGDNLWIIAKRCKKSVAELTRLNDLKNPEQLQVGQVLQIKERSKLAKRKTAKVKKSFEPSVKRSDEVFVEEPKAAEPIERENSHKTAPALDDDDFRDLFEENKDMPIVPIDVTQ